MLTDVSVINQKMFKAITKFAMRHSDNILVLGPSGGGKTIITQEAAIEEKARLVYINLSVLERTDFQGFPVISNDKTLVSYATPDFLPFADTSTRDERAVLERLMKAIDSNDKNNKPLIQFAETRLGELKQKEDAQAIMAATPFIAASSKDVVARFQDLLKTANKWADNDIPVVFLFDEVDKAATETTQTLLELLQFNSINGRKLNVRACILTGNLPDEHAHTNQISHAISKRCKSFKLEIDFNQWREWAFKHEVHDHVIQYLSSEPGMIHKVAPDGDPTAYALPSPRTWTEAGRALTYFDTDPNLSKLPDDQLLAFKFKMVAGNVGDGAATKFKNWYQYYRRFDPAINALIEKGVMPNISNLQAQEILIMAISACSRVYTELKPNNAKRIKPITQHVYKWMQTLQPDTQMGAIRLSFGGDWENCHKYGLSNIPEFVIVFKNIKKKLGDWESDLSPNR